MSVLDSPADRRASLGRGILGAVRRRAWIATVLACLMVVAVRWVTMAATDPTVAFLTPGPGEWIQRGGGFSPFARPVAREVALFRRSFTLPQAVERADLSIRAFRRCCVWIDGDPAADEPWACTAPRQEAFRTTTTITLRQPLAAGGHVAYLLVENASAPACVTAASDALGLRTGAGWESLAEGGGWEPARLATRRPRNDLAALYPSVAAAAARAGPWLALVFLAAVAAVTALDRAGRLSPAAIRSVIIAAWILLCGTNLFRIPPAWGFDLRGHLEYVRFVAAEGRLPLATDGWTMFQPPLFYLVAAACRSVLGQLVAPETADLLLRLVPMACGAALIELCHRAGRLCFPADPWRQTVATLVGGCMPITLYQCQVVHNEPLAAVLAAATFLGCLHLLADSPAVQRRWFAPALGAAWGLALLTKSTPLLLGPFLLFALVCQGVSRRESWPRVAARAGVVFGTAALVAGWYYLRNWLVFGRPFIGGWDRGRGFDWWQDPGFRCPSQLTDFGTSLVAPVYSGTWGLLDSLHSTLWTDGFLSGGVVPPERVPWNLPWLVLLSPLGLLPLACLLAGACGTVVERAGRDQTLTRFALAVIAVHLLAIVDLWLRLPVYSTAKGSYLLGVVPAIGIVAAAGAGSFLGQGWPRRLFLSALLTWAAAGFIAFTCRAA